jgi:peptidoglycan/LPS O-acetylase OafA/YrhL
VDRRRTGEVRVCEVDDRSRFAGLDSLRAIAVVLVIWFHFGEIPGTSRVPIIGVLSHPQAGYLGAELFFVLSGFLITSLLLRERNRTGSVDVKAFYLRRVFRLMPALVLALVVLAGVNARLHEPIRESVLGVVAAIGYQFNVVAYFHSHGAHPELGGVAWGHLWSLSVEEQFYLVWPIVLGSSLVVHRLAGRRLACALAGLASALTLWRTWLWASGASTLRLYLMTDTRADALLIGAATAAALHAAGRWTPDVRLRRMVAPTGLVAVAAFAFFGSRWDTVQRPGWMYGPGFTVFSLCSAVLLVCVVHPSGSWLDRLLASRSMVAVGRRSYGLYLFHYPARALALGHPGSWALAVAGTGLAAEVSLRLVERPWLARTPRWATSPNL